MFNVHVGTTKHLAFLARFSHANVEGFVSGRRLENIYYCDHGGMGNCTAVVLSA